MNPVALVEWAQGFHRRGTYSPVGLGFHWLMAALMTVQLGHGWYLAWQPAGGVKHLGYQTHAQIGLAIMLLGTLRFFWRGRVAAPRTVDEHSFMGRASLLVQVGLYFSFFALPISGWVMWSTLPGDLPLSIAGVVPVPNLPFEQLSERLQHALMQGAATAHLWIVWFTTLAIAGHSGAAVLHHVIARDRVLNAMIDLNGPEAPGVLGSPRDAGPAA